MTPFEIYLDLGVAISLILALVDLFLPVPNSKLPLWWLALNVFLWPIALFVLIRVTVRQWY